MKFPTERIPRRTDGTTQLVLTTHRLRLETATLGSASIVSIMLEGLASCRVSRTSRPLFLILATISLLSGLLIGANNGKSGVFVVGVLAAALFGALYYASRLQVLSLRSAADRAQISTRGMSLDAVREFIDEAEEAKNVRYLSHR